VIFAITTRDYLKLAAIRAAQKLKHRDDQKTDRGALSSFYFNCSGLGLDSAGRWLIAAIKRLDCAPTSLC
jgi:hypothetical protein